MKQIPVMILTGFLGAGKTTLLKRVLEEPHGQKIAVIENEFGEENIDKELLVMQSDEQIYQMSNGCICCTIREDLRLALQTLAARQREGTIAFDRVIIETTGLADPGPVAQTFFMDDAVKADYVLDSVITVVDAKHAQQQLNSRKEAALQIGFADRIFISKADLVSAQEVEALQHRIRHINARAPQQAAHFGQVDIRDIFDIRGFSLGAALAPDPEARDSGCGQHHHDHGHADCAGHPKHHHQDDSVKSFVFRAQAPCDPARFEAFLTNLVQEHGPQLLRYKGVVAMSDFDRKLIFQGVHQTLGNSIGPRWKPGEARESRMVFIGIDLPQDRIVQGLKACLEPQPVY